MAPYPDDYFKLGKYLVLSVDIGPALMAKIIKENKNRNGKNAKPNVVHSWSLLTSSFALMLWQVEDTLHYDP